MKSDMKAAMKTTLESIQSKPMAICIAIPLAVGALSSLLTMGSMKAFAHLRQPPLSPPGWLFPVVWSVLYILMGISTYLVYTARETPQMRFSALIAYGIMLVFNFVWPLLFFRMGMRLVAFVWLLLLLGLVLLTASLFYQVRKIAGLLYIPYLAWMVFAGYLNFGVYWLNR